MKPEYLDFLKTLIEYDPTSGIFRWLVARNSHGGKVIPGAIAGTKNDGYVQIIVDQRKYRAHRLAWLLMTGEFPVKGYEIDHINGARDDNRWENLRLVTRHQNNMNMGVSKANRSGVRGVSWLKRRNKWHARIKVEGRVICLGDFVSLEAAAAARKAAEEKYFGEFMRK
ncbi:HNH endonuclease signature motif containing protein (plasmid) [Ralstonia syzygii subsp. celebesensis]|uniref:HNH endonuclease signature motif containing protein n=1 Tax=Ralstonia syzygii TaxID=28097 RepID=UPI00387E0C06